MFRYLLFIAFITSTMVSFAQDPVFDHLVWADEFETNGAIDSNNWHHQTQLPNGTGWYNNEIQHYTNRQDNSYVDNGLLIINAKKETFTDQGVTKEYTSARLNSKFAFTYGRIEIRAILPTGVGTWPAMWTLGKNIIEPGGFWSDTHGTIGWPACGELDMMEHWGLNQDYVQSATHTPSSSGNTVNKGGQVVPNASNEFHIYELEWFADKIVFKVDGAIHYTYQPAVQNGDTWPFDLEQYLLLNVAVLPSIDPAFTESAMEIDYVRIYQETPLAVLDSPLMAEIFVYPNPVDEVLTVKIPNKHVGATVSLYSILGKEVLNRTLTTTETQFDLSSYSGGLFLLQINTKSGNFTQSILK